MARTQRVRALLTGDLVAEFEELYIQWAFGEVDGLTDAQWDRLFTRLDRVGRELARRDYRFRPHGRACSCAECMDLLDTWSRAGRRVPPELKPWQ